MKRFYLFLLSGLLALTQFTAVAQLQMGFHYKIMNKYDAATSIRYKVIYSTIATPTPAATTTTTTFSVPATAAIPRTHTTPAVPAIATTTITTTTITPAVIPAVAPSITTTITNIQKYPIKKLNAGIKQKGDSLIIDFWSILPSSDPVAGNKAAINSADGLGKYICGTQDCKSLYYIPITPRASIGTPTYYVSLPYATSEIGLITIPFKYRSGNGSETGPNRLASAVNAGVYVGRKWGRTRFYADPTRVSTGWSFMLAAVATPTVISITATNTAPVVINPSDEVGYSLGTAALGSYGSFTAGLVGGWDFPATEQAKKWVYANKFWLGFGLGYKLGSFGDR